MPALVTIFSTEEPAKSATGTGATHPPAGSAEGVQVIGIAIPPGTVKFHVKPVLRGAGNVTPLYEGDVSEGATPLSEVDILDAVANNDRFWKWVDKVALPNNRCDPPKNGLHEWRVRIDFFDHVGVKSESAATDKPLEFYRYVSASGAGSIDPTTAAIQAVRDMQTQFIQAQQRMMTEHAQVMRDMTATQAELLGKQLAAAKEMVTTATTESAKLLSAGAQPLQDAVGRVVDWSKHEQEKRDEATKDVVTLLQRGGKDEDLLSQVVKLAPLAAAAQKFMN